MAVMTCVQRAAKLTHSHKIAKSPIRDHSAHSGGGEPQPASKASWQTRCLALHAFDVPVHGPETGVVDRLALRHALGAGVVDDGPGEGMDGAINDALLHALGIGDHVFRDLLVVVP